MSKHTPGPWIVREVSGAGWPGQRGFAIDYNAEQEQIVDFVYEEADAHLIAAAPELLEAIEELMDGYLYGCDKETKRENAKRAREAIAKAKGERP